MTPDDLTAVLGSWHELRPRRAALDLALRRAFEANDASTLDPATQARWLMAAVDELVELLATPSQLAARARTLGATWPDPCTAPSFAVEGRAWLAACADCLPSWSSGTARSWTQAWLLLSDVLAAEALSPFAELPPASPADRPVGDHRPTQVSTTPPNRGPLP